jgi:hypothetical protein
MFGFLDFILQYQLMIAPQNRERVHLAPFIIGKEAQNKPIQCPNGSI